MRPIVLQGRLVSADVWLSEPEIGTFILASEISVPGELETRGIYAAEIAIFSGENRIEFAGDVVVEPAQTNAIWSAAASDPGICNDAGAVAPGPGRLRNKTDD
jgi:hypothetical protein